jgi:hypothetical protein
MVAFAPSSLAANPSIVGNPNFASPAVSGQFETFYAGSTDIPAWGVSAGSIDIETVFAPPAGSPAGTQEVDLSGDGPGSLFDDLSTKAGMTYQGSFELSGNNQSCGTAVKTGFLSVGSLNLPFSFDATGNSFANPGWVNVPFSFVATGPVMQMTFTSTTAGSCGPLITDVSVVPPLAPTITTNPNITTDQIQPGGRTVSFPLPTGTDANSGLSLPVSCSPASGSLFPVGTTTVTCTANDDGVTASSTFTVKVNPALPPVIATNPNLSVYQTTPAGTPLPFTPPTATDPNPNGFTASVGCVPGSNSVFPVGTTTVTCTATEPEGPTATSKFTVTVHKITSACQGLPLDDKGYLKAHPNYAANGPITPCVASTYDSIPVGPIVVLPGVPLLHINPTGLNVAVLHGVTDSLATPGLVQSSANSTVAAVAVSAPGLTLEAHGLYSQASSTLSGGLCNDGVTTGNSTIASLVINGKTINVGTAPITIKLPGLIDIYINQTVRVGNVVTQRALYIDLLSHSTYITAGQSEAGVTCS